MKRRLTWSHLLAVALLGLLSAREAHAHATGENYVWLNVGESGFEGRFEIRLDDLRTKLDLPVPEDVDAARAYVDETAPEVIAYLRRHFEIEAAGAPVPWELERTDLFEEPGLGHFAQYWYRTAELAVPDVITVRNEIFQAGDRFHRGLLCIETNARTGEEYGGEFTALIFGPSNPEQDLDLTAIESILNPRDFVWQGVLHIWIGIDHVLFLCTLLLPAVLMYRRTEQGARWEPLPDFRSALWNIVKIVTLFTIAHSITLTLAALDIVRLPSRFVESTIAVSIVLVALNNIYPRFHAGTGIVVFFFGLFHGLGFASVMGELPFRMSSLVKVVLAFNVGVELGQAVIVALAFPILYWLARSPSYPRTVLAGGSGLIGLVAMYWFLERALGVSL